MKRVLVVILLILLLTFNVSCSKNEDTVDNIISIDDSAEIVSDNNSDDNDNQSQEDEKIDDLVVSPDENEDYSKLDGMIYQKELLENRPIVVSIDNHPKARAQAGLSEAEIVYEVEAEAPYTRYLAVFQTADKDILIGPVRSARPYLIYLSLEYDSLFAHCGGSPEAFEKLDSLAVADIDGLYTSKMWRYMNTGKYAPHNLYTNLKSLRKDASNKNYRKNFVLNGFSFNEKDSDLSEDNIANEVQIVYNRDNSTNYVFDKSKKIYIRQKDGVNHVDENNNVQITAKNIIIYFVDKKVLDNEGRLYLGVIGKGEGYYITNGKYEEITWSKISEKSNTKFYIGDQELKLNKGNTWIQVVSNGEVVNITE